MMITNVLIILCTSALSLTLFVPGLWQNAMASTETNTLEINVYHRGYGETEICIKDNDYEDTCKNFDLTKYRNPFVFEITIEDPRQGETFDICYEDKNSNQDGCKEYELKGRSLETVDLVLPGASMTGSSLPSINNDFQPSPTPPPIPATPSSPNQDQNTLSSPSGPSSLSNQDPQEQGEVSWKTFRDRNGLFTVQYPSNWLPSYPSEPLGPIDIQLYFGDGRGDAFLNIYKMEGISPFLTSNESIDSSLSYDQSTLNNFRLLEPIKCVQYSINGVPACSYTASFTADDGTDQTYLFLRAVTPDGTEYGAIYMSSANLFNHFKTTVDHMIESFSVTSVSQSRQGMSMSNMTG
jgi:hypothetical protein